MGRSHSASPLTAGQCTWTTPKFSTRTARDWIGVTCSIFSKTATADAAAAAASVAEVSEEIEHVFEFSASFKAGLS